jgi:hypothetical protein
MAMVSLLFAEREKWTISVRVRPLNGERQQAHDQHRSEKSH